MAVPQMNRAASDLPAGEATATPIGPRPIELLTVSTLYPNNVKPGHGIFVETRLRHLLATGEVAARVLAPVPWFPFKSKAFGSYSQFAGVQRTDQRNGIDIAYPRYPVIPKVGMTLTPWLMAQAIRPAVRAAVKQRPIHAIDAHYFYPDGVAAAILARELNLPVVITARGTDINLIPQHTLPRKMIQWAAGQASAMITVCGALRDSLVALGANSSRVHVLRNGVDLTLFHPMDKAQARTQTAMQGRTLLSVGHLIERKGHHLIIEALAQLPQVNLVIVGGGPWEGRLRQLAEQCQVADRVTFAGTRPQSELVAYYSAADALVLASSREGMANVLLESLACGTPVLATNLWGTPEVIAAPQAGELMADRTATALVDAVTTLFNRYPSREATRAYAEGFSWDPTTAGQLQIFNALAAGQNPPSAA